MLSRKLLGGVAVGILSVALVPVTWARTHIHQTAKTSTPAKLVVTQPSSKRTTLSATGAKKVTAHRVATHKLASHHILHGKTSHTKLVSHKKPVSHTTKLTMTKKPVSKKLVGTKKIAK
jgi:hypothetical protein